MDKVKVVLWGFGAMGSGMAKMLLTKKGVEIVGVCDMHPERVNKSIYDILKVDREDRQDAVSYTHLDVYKRQFISCSGYR